MPQSEYNPAALRELIIKAKGGRKQNTFADEVGISPYTLCRLLKKNGNAGRPRKETLLRIAAASEGRVSETMLLNACGYDTSGEAYASLFSPDSLSPSEKGILAAANIKKGLGLFCGTAVRHASVEDALGMVLSMYGTPLVSLEAGEEMFHQGVGHKGAEFLRHCRVYWTDGDYDEEFLFTLFYCRTVSGGCILSEALFSLADLMSAGNGRAVSFYNGMGEKEKGDMGNMDMVVLRREHAETESERLIKSVFNRHT